MQYVVDANTDQGRANNIHGIEFNRHSTFVYYNIERVLGLGIVESQ